MKRSRRRWAVGRKDAELRLDTHVGHIAAILTDSDTRCIGLPSYCLHAVHASELVLGDSQALPVEGTRFISDVGSGASPCFGRGAGSEKTADETHPRVNISV